MLLTVELAIVVVGGLVPDGGDSPEMRTVFDVKLLRGLEAAIV